MPLPPLSNPSTPTGTQPSAVDLLCDLSDLNIGKQQCLKDPHVYRTDYDWRPEQCCGAGALIFLARAGADFPSFHLFLPELKLLRLYKKKILSRESEPERF